MKKIIPFLLCMLIALWACEKDTPTPPASIDSMQFEGVTTTLNEGESINLSQYLVITPASVGDTVTVEWSSNNEEIATVSASGSVEALRAGDVTITAKAMDKTAQVKLTIDKVKIKEFTVPAHLEVYVGEKIKFPINDLKPKNAPLYRFEWEADNDGKEPTYSEGKWYLKADKEREYTLTASVDDADEAKCNVKFVKPSVSKLAFNPASYTVEAESSLSLKTNLVITPADGMDADTIKVVWSSSKESVATIDQNGKVQAIAAGKATITAKAGGKTATCTVTVTAKPGSEDPEKPTDPEKPEDPETPEDPDTPVDPSDPEIPIVTEYTVSYDANGGTGSMSEVKVKEGESVTISACEFTRNGYRFIGWNTSSSGNGIAYLPNATFSPTSDTKLYAQWEEVYTIKFNVNEVKGVNDGSGYMDDIVLSKGQSVKLPKNAFNLFGGEFISWNTSKDGSGTEYNDQANITPSSNLTLYAQWKITKGKENGYVWVDLGLPSGNKWALYNIGASSDTGYGDYYAWGETSTKLTYDASTYTYTSTPTILPASKDVAQVEWGGKWGMPTLQDFQELIDNCTWDRFKVSGTQVYTLTSKKNNQTIVFVTAGYRTNTVAGNNVYALYWTSTSVDSDYAYIYNAESKTTSTWSRVMGLPVRAVLKK